MGSWSSRDILSIRVQKSFLLKTLRLETAEVSFHVKHYESLYDLANLPHFWEPYKNEKFISTFSE